jgi:hypothetical protein
MLFLKLIQITDSIIMLAMYKILPQRYQHLLDLRLMQNKKAKSLKGGEGVNYNFIIQRRISIS